MAKKLPKRMKLKSGVYYFVDLNSKWKPLGRDFSQALENYLTLYGAHCSSETRDSVTDLFLASMAS